MRVLAEVSLRAAAACALVAAAPPALASPQSTHEKHPGLGLDFYHPRASHEIFDQFPDVGIKAITFDEIFYSRNSNRYIHRRDNPNHSPDDKLCISGTEAREMLKKAKAPPVWFLRKEIAQLIINAIKKGERVFE